ncbi:MAG: tetratricopeptide repeat protein, partial [Pseudomonadota bacterium]
KGGIGRLGQPKMSNNETFIDEVSEEVRRDQLFALFRRWGWLAGLIVLALVGTAAFFEVRRSQEERASQAFGDAVLVALEGETAEARQAALSEISPESPGAEMLLALLTAAQASDAGDAETAAGTLRAVAEQSQMPQRYRDLALLKAHMLAPQAAEVARATLDRLAQPGAPYRPLALEQLAYVEIAEGDVEAGLAVLEELRVEAGVSLEMRDRARIAISALSQGATLSDAPLPEPTAVEDAADPLALPPANFGAAEDDEAPTESNSEEDADASDVSE